MPIGDTLVLASGPMCKLVKKGCQENRSHQQIFFILMEASRVLKEHCFLGVKGGP